MSLMDGSSRMDVKLLSLSLSGFKSFAGTGELVLADGITGIFGDNGSGKSNLVTALLWGIGGAADDDALIFANSNGPDAGEVRLKFSSHGDRLTEICRQIRAGTAASYAIDGRPAETGDIHSMLAELGIDADALTILRPETIGALLHAPASERLRILELGHGEDGLATRQRKAQQRLDQAMAQLRVLDSNAAGLSTRIEGLREDTQHASRAMALGRRIHSLDAHLQLYSLQQAERRCENIRLRIKAIAAQIETDSGHKEQQRMELDRIRQAIGRAEILLGKAQTDLAGAQVQRAQAIGEEARIRSIIDELDSFAGLLDEQITSHRQILHELQNTTISPGKDHAPAGKAFDEKRASQSIQEVSQRTALAQAKLEEVATAITAAKADEQYIEREQRRLDLLTEHKEELQQIGIGTDNIHIAEQKLAEAIKGLNATGTAGKQARYEQKVKAASLEQLRNKRDRISERIHALRGHIHAHRSEMAMLEMMLCPGEITGMDTSSSSLLSSIKYEPETIGKALLSAIGPEIHASTDSNEPEHWRNESGAVGLYLPEGVKPLSELVQAPDWLLRRLSQCGLVEVEAGERLQSLLQQGQCLVSVHGDMWRWDGLVRRAGQEQNTSVIAARHQQCERRLAESREQLRTVREEENKILTRLDQASKEANAAKIAENESSMKLALARESVSRAEYRLERIKAVGQATDKIRNLIDKMGAACHGAIKGLAVNGSASNEPEDRLLLEEAQMQLKRAWRQEIETRIHVEQHLEQTRRDSILGERAQQEQERIHKINASIEAIGNSIARQYETLLCLRRKIAEKHEASGKEHERISQQISTLDSSIARYSENLQIAKRELTALVTECANREEKLLEAYRSSSLQTSMLKEESALEDALVREERIESATMDRFGVDKQGLEALVRVLPAEIDDNFEVNAENVREKSLALQKMLAERDEMSEYDPTAEQKLKEAENSLQNSMAEREELSSAIDRVRESLGFLRQSTNSRLLSRLNEASSKFDNLFSMLFGGGKGKLALTKPDRNNESGMEIYVAPPGRSMAPIGQLSHGEQTLAMLACIFAVFLDHPAPLCAFDQIDNMLDDKGTDKFIRLLQGISKTTGARIILTSNNLALAPRLDLAYRVSMNESGISTLEPLAVRPAAGTAAA